MTRAPKHPAFVVRGERPYNAGPPLDRLHETYVTPEDLFFVRNHGSVPELDPTRHRLRVHGLVATSLTLTLDELRAAFPRRQVTATLQCAGNRRRELIAVTPIPGEIPWEAEAVGTAVWEGAALRDILDAAAVSADARHVAFLGGDLVEKHGQSFGFGGSIPLEKAMSEEVLVADAMNGAPLGPLHGYPLRAVVPGYIGARSVKWLAEIIVQATPSTNHFQTHAYKLFPPHVGPAEADWSAGLTLGEFPVNAVICQPLHHARVPAGPVVVRGYALAGGGRRVKRVELSSNDGATWMRATLSGETSPWAWRLWEAAVTLDPGLRQLAVRAWDSAGQVQPEDIRTVWNFKGYVNNAWHRIDVTVLPAPDG